MSARTTITDRCPGTMQGGGYNPRTYQCQSKAGHSGKCHYYRLGGQGGSTWTWWGVNARPITDTEDMSDHEKRVEIGRLRALLNEAGIDWIEGLK